MDKTNEFLKDLIAIMTKHNVTLCIDEVALLDFEKSKSGNLIGILKQSLDFNWTSE